MIALHSEQCTFRSLEDDKFCFVLCPECWLVFGLHVGIVDRFETLIVADIFDERLYLTKTSFDLFQVIAGTGIGAVNVLNLLFKISILQKVVFS